jgi:LEA14-like dessication related protein
MLNLISMNKFYFAVIVLVAACVPKSEIVLQDIRNIEVISGQNGAPLLKANAFFHNPNRVKMTLREIKIQVFLDGKLTANSDQKMNAAIPAKDDFMIPLQVTLNLKEVGLLDTLFGFLAGKSHEVRYLGFAKVKVHGIVINIPVDYKSSLKLKL